MRNANFFRKGLDEAGYVEDKNVTVEYDWLDGRFDRLSSVMADGAPSGGCHSHARWQLRFPGGKSGDHNDPYCIRRRRRPVRLGLERSNRRLQIQILNASTKDEIDAAFTALVRDQIDALFVVPDAFLLSQCDQFAALTARYRIPAAFPDREAVEAGGLMSYGSDTQSMWRQVGVYTGQILKGAKPADLPVVRPTKFEFVINLKTAKALGLTVPPTLLAIADDVIE